MNHLSKISLIAVIAMTVLSVKLLHHLDKALDR